MRGGPRRGIVLAECRKVRGNSYPANFIVAGYSDGTALPKIAWADPGSQSTHGRFNSNQRPPASSQRGQMDESRRLVSGCAIRSG